MKKEKKYEILKSLPPYGPMYTSISEDGTENYSEGYVLKFFKSDNTEWVANFKTGWTDFYYVHSFDNNEFILVISGGTCYIMHPNEKKQRSVFGVRYKSVIEMKNGGLILEDLTDLTIVEPNGEFWHSERISFDGLKDIKLIDNVVSGLSFEPTTGDGRWIEFSLNLETKELYGGSFNQLFGNKKKSYQTNGETESKPWWKIW